MLISIWETNKLSTQIIIMAKSISPTLRLEIVHLLKSSLDEEEIDYR